jgi:hypothetical protein
MAMEHPGEAMTKDIDTDAGFFAGGREHLQRQKTMRAIFDDGEWLTAESINTLQPSPPVNKSHPANDWKRGGLVFSVAHDGEEYFPSYQFDAMYQPKPVISDIWGVHLTGVSDLPPRAARRRSLQAGRMSALPRRLWRNSLIWALVHNKVLVTNRSRGDSKL